LDAKYGKRIAHELSALVAIRYNAVVIHRFHNIAFRDGHIIAFDCHINTDHYNEIVCR